MSFIDRLIRGVPVWRRIVERPTPLVRKQLVAGGAAGVIAVSEIKRGDQLVSVMEFAATSNDLTDRTAEFLVNTDERQTIQVDGEIDNTGGTATTGDDLWVEWLAWAE